MTRVRCLVPHCACSRGDRKGDRFPIVTDDLEFICRKHWAMAPRSWKRRLQLFRRRRRADLENVAWTRIKRIVVERAVGI